MHRGMATGLDEIPVNILKITGEIGLELLKRLFNNIFKAVKLPKSWGWSMMIPLYNNKGDILCCNNYRSIKLLSNTMKVLEMMEGLRLKRIMTIFEN